MLARATSGPASRRLTTLRQRRSGRGRAEGQDGAPCERGRPPRRALRGPADTHRRTAAVDEGGARARGWGLLGYQSGRPPLSSRPPVWVDAARRFGLSLEVVRPGFSSTIPISRSVPRAHRGGKVRFRLVRRPGFSTASRSAAPRTGPSGGHAGRRPGRQRVNRVNASLDLKLCRFSRFRSDCISALARRRLLSDVSALPGRGQARFSPWPVAVSLGGYCRCRAFLISVRAGRAALALLGCGREDIELAPADGGTAPSVIVAPRFPKASSLLGRPMGWNGYNAFGCAPELDEAKVKANDRCAGRQRHAERRLPLCQPGRLLAARAHGGGQGRSIPMRLPGGIEALSNDVHARGLSLGVWAPHHDCGRSRAARGTRPSMRRLRRLGRRLREVRQLRLRS